MSKSSYKDLLIWQKAIVLTEHIYRLTDRFPQKEQYGLVAQMRRSAVSIASNIAEGSARHSDKEFSHFLVIARGSLAELTTQAIIAQRVGFLTMNDLHLLSLQFDEIGRMLQSLKSSLSKAPPVKLVKTVANDSTTLRTND